MVLAVPDQKTLRIVELLMKEAIPFCGVPEALLTDRGTNLLSRLILDICSKLGIAKMNTTAYHPDVMVWSRGLIIPLSPCFVNMLTSLEHSGTSLYLVCCGCTETHPMGVLARSHISFKYKICIKAGRIQHWSTNQTP